MLGKLLNLGGIDNKPPKANQGTGRFRVARNVYPTPDSRIIPRYHNDVPDAPHVNADSVMCIANYNSKPLDMASHNSFISFYLDSVLVPRSSQLGASPYPSIIPGDGYYTNPPMNYRRNNTTFFINPYDATMMKYDGVEMQYAGVNQPYFSTSLKTPGTLKYVRAIQHRIDFDNNEPMSEFIDFIDNSDVETIRTDSGGGSVIGSIGTPQTEIVPLLKGSNYFKNYVCTYDSVNDEFDLTEAPTRSTTSIGTAVLSISVTSDLRVGMVVTGSGVPADSYIVSINPGVSITLNNSTTAGTYDISFLGDTNITDVDQVGSYVIVAASYTDIFGMGLVSPVYFGLALKVKSVSPLTLDANDAYLLDSNREWQKDPVNVGTVGVAAGIKWGTRNFLSFWEGLSSTGIFYIRDFAPAFPESTKIYVQDLTLTGVATASGAWQISLFTVGPVLNDFYDVTTRKLSINSVYPFGLEHSMIGMTVYQDQLLITSDDLVWINDTSLGGVFEQFSTSNFIRVGDTEFGRTTGICGTADFLVVSRERKNYYVNGNIITGNYRVQEVAEAEVGSWSNTSIINVKDTVILLTALGVYQILVGGKGVNLSANTPKNFSTYDSMNVNEDVVFKIDGFVSSLSIEDSGAGVVAAYDEYRELLAFMKIGIEEKGSCLVIHTRTGESYEWSGLLLPVDDEKSAQSLAFIDAKYYVGYTDYKSGARDAQFLVEDKEGTLDYVEDYPVRLFSTWLTAGEPSLEKNLLQLKMFGRFQSNGTTSAVKVVSFKDWNISTRTTNEEYFTNSTNLSLNNQTQYSHKKRLNSEKVLAASVGIELSDPSSTFEIESFEVEFNPIQQGMKR